MQSTLRGAPSLASLRPPSNRPVKPIDSTTPPPSYQRRSIVDFTTVTTPFRSSLSLTDVEKTLRLGKIAKDTVYRISKGYYRLRDPVHPSGVRVVKISAEANAEETQYYAPGALQLVDWISQDDISIDRRLTVKILVLPLSSVEGIQYMRENVVGKGYKIGVLSFASARQPGGGFLHGARTQEASLLRVSTLSVSLNNSTARPFYDHHERNDRGGYYTHSMIYSPHVAVFKDSFGETIRPIVVDVVSASAVNAKAVKNHAIGDTKQTIGATMLERMGRILSLFERNGVRYLVLGSFGTGKHQNDAGLVASLWAKLLDARFKNSFDVVIFAIPDQSTVRRYFKAFPDVPR